MDYIVKIASGFTGLFDEGAKVFVSWVGGIAVSYTHLRLLGVLHEFL